jgi:hypothetical protein
VIEEVQQEKIEVNYAVIGCVQDLTYHPKFALQNPKLKVYKWNKETGDFEFFHET